MTRGHAPRHRLRSERAAGRGGASCASCGAEQAAGSKFCTGCGAKAATVDCLDEFPFHLDRRNPALDSPEAIETLRGLRSGPARAFKHPWRFS